MLGRRRVLVEHVAARYNRRIMNYITKSDEMIARNPVEGLNGTILHSPTMTIAHWNFVAGTALPEHKHHHEQVALVVEGELELTIDGNPRILKPGDGAVIPGNVPHSARAVTDCRVVDTFHPVREDLK